MTTPTTHISGDAPACVANSVFRIQDGWMPQIVFGRCERLRCGGTEFPNLVDEVTLLDDRLRLVLVEADGELLRTFVSKFDNGGFEVGVTFAGGLELQSASGFITRRSFSYGESRLTTLVLDLFDWSASKGGGQPACWVGELIGPLFSAVPGNLVSTSIVAVEGAPEVTSDCYHHFRLEGRNNYFLVFRSVQAERSAAWHVVIDAATTTLEREPLNLDLLALQFALGRRQALPLLFAIDDKGEVVGAMSGPMLSRPQALSAHRETIPLTSTTPWLVSFFKQVSEALRTRADWRLYVPISHFLDSIGDSLDGERIKLYIALESAAYWIGGADKAEKRLLRDLLPHAFAAMGLHLDPKLLDSIGEERSRVVHTGMVLDDPNAPVDHRVLRAQSETLRTMIVALVARCAGYEGEIWDPAAVAPSLHWRVTDECRTSASRRFELKRTLAMSAPDKQLTILVETEIQKVIAEQVLGAAQLRADVDVVVAEGGMAPLARAFTDRGQRIAVLMEGDRGTLGDAARQHRALFDESHDVTVFSVVPSIEAWAFADDRLVASLPSLGDHARSILTRLPLPEEIPNPRLLLEQLVGGSVEWGFLANINLEHAMARSASFRVFVDGVRALLGRPASSTEPTGLRSFPRDLIASLLVEKTPGTAVAWRTADGSVFTVDELRKEIEAGTELGRQYATDLLRVARDLLGRLATSRR